MNKKIDPGKELIYHDIGVYQTMDPKIPEFWVGQKVTLPPIEYGWEEMGGEDFMSEKDFNHLKQQEGKLVLIYGIQADVDGTAENCYYSMMTGNGLEFEQNFRIFPIEMAIKFQTAGHGHFAEVLPLNSHPHFRRFFQGNY